MCGIFGFASHGSSLGHRTTSKIINKLFLLSESRGKEASGIAVDLGTEIVVSKSPFPASEFIKSQDFIQIQEQISDQILNKRNIRVLGHSRLVTNGYEQFNYNNQPVIRDNIVLVHNGIIVNVNHLWEKYENKEKMTDLDSEIIPVILSDELAKGSALPEVLRHLYSQIYGMTTFASFLVDYQSMLLSTNNGSLYYYISREKNLLIFASERGILEKVLQEFTLKSDLDETSIIQLKPNEYLLEKSDGFIVDTSLTSSQEPTSLYAIPRKISVKVNDLVDEGKVFLNTSLNYSHLEPPKEFEEYYKNCKENISEIQRCTKCLLPKSFPFIVFDHDGVCNFCLNYSPLQYKGIDSLINDLSVYKSSSANTDCLIPLSGGRDSSYVLHFIKKEMGMNPIAYSYDWGMLTDLARRNQSRLCGALGVEHILISADIRKKRDNIRKNVEAWLKKPNLGTIPLFMAGDKQYFYLTNKLMKEYSLGISIYGENRLETTNFKSGFAGISPSFNKNRSLTISSLDKVKMLTFYGKEFITNPSFLNSSLFDSFDAFKSYYLIKHNSMNFFWYHEWDEESIVSTLRNNYDWELADDTKSSWRIGDGTAAFYNYIYFMVAGFTENDTFRSNQIREGVLTRAEALELVETENYPRWDSIQWYCNTIKVDFESTIRIINNIKKLY